MRTLKMSFFAIMMGALATSCSKTGPTGPAGPAGANGAANVYTETETVNPGDWSQSNSTTWYYVTAVSIPTGDVVNVYISLNGNAYTPLATNSFFYSGDEVTFVYGNGGNLTIWDYFSSLSPNTTIDVKIVDVPPAVYVKHPNINWKNYSEVTTLPEIQASLSRVK